MARVALALGAVIAPGLAGAQTNAEIQRTSMEAMDQQGLNCAVVFMGDSMVRRWFTERVIGANASVNWGIGGAWTQIVRTQTAGLNALHTARAIVLWVGVNDARSTWPMELVYNDQNILMNQISAPMVVIGSPVPYSWAGSTRTPEDGMSRVHLINAEWQRLCALKSKCAYVHPPWGEPVHPDFLMDGLHFNKFGYSKLEPLVRQALTRVQRAPLCTLGNP